MKKRIFWWTLVVLAITIWLGCAFQPWLGGMDDRQAEVILAAYLLDRGSEIKPGSEVYRRFLKGILLGEHPDLTRPGSKWSREPGDVDRIIRYAAAHIDAPNEPTDMIWSWFRASEDELPEATIPQRDVSPGGNPIQ